MDDSAVATKADITMIMDEIGRLYDANERWKSDLEEKTERWKNEIKDHFDLTAENIRHDLMSANHDKVELLSDRSENHERRIGRLEKHVNLR